MAKILVIDDDVTVGIILTDFLSQMEHVVTVAHNGLEGLAAANLNVPDFIILDVDMPKLNGFETCARLRAEPKTQKILILMLTGRATLPDAMQSLDLGATDHMAKPFDLNEVAARVKTLLAKRL